MSEREGGGGFMIVSGGHIHTHGRCITFSHYV